MKIAKTYALYSALILFATVILISSVWFSKKNDEERQILQEQHAVFERYQAVLNLESSAMTKATFDYSFWDEMVEFIQTKDAAWSKRNLDPILKTFNADLVMVYNPEKEPVYVKGNGALASLRLDLSTLSLEKPVFHEFFTVHDHTFVQIFLAPVHMSDDLDRKGKPLGFFVIGRKWDQAFLDTIAKISLGKARLVSNDASMSTDTAFTMPLKTLEGDTVGHLIFSYTPSVLLFISSLQNNIVILGLCILFFALFLFYLLTRRTLFKPIHYISMALKTHQLNYITALSRQKNELGEIAKLIYEHERQTSMLEHYKDAVDETAIVSKTTPQGLITYANEQFIAVSGYSKEELIGKPHNIVRHPDTPSSLFQEMWTTLKDGKTWKGIIKNRHKNGQAYFVKSAIMPLLNAQREVEEYIAIRYDVTELFEQMDHLRKENLIELPGRKVLFETIEKCMDPHLAILNICGFREINTLHGQAFGDTLLQQLAFKIRMLIPDTLGLFHLQGDEFALLNDQTLSQEDFIHTCETLLSSLNEEGVMVYQKYYPIALRVGIANKAEHLYNRAEIALEEARESHKSLVVYDDNEGFTKRLEGDIAWNKTLRYALLHNRFTIFLQEIVPLHDMPSQRKKYEVLIRLIDEKGKIISPFHFLDLAKRMHVYHQLTRFVIQEGFRAALELHCDISLNLSQEDITNKETASFLASMLEQYPNLKERVTLELVESEGIENSQEVESFLTLVRHYGCLLAIDDFGAGYSNFEYLLRLRVDFIKIDGSLIKHIDTDENAYTTVKAITHFAKSLGISVVAEFVHNEAILTLVKELGIDFAQGYYLHEPSPKPKIIRHAST
jgi:PAS domain S-box-containing protein